MSVVNRRNAILGWAVWNASKTMAKRKAKSAVPSRDDDSRVPKKSAVAAAVAAAGGAVWFLRRRSGSSDES
jgi:hypothetical protein